MEKTKVYDIQETSEYTLEQQVQIFEVCVDDEIQVHVTEDRVPPETCPNIKEAEESRADEVLNEGPECHLYTISTFDRFCIPKL